MQNSLNQKITCSYTCKTSETCIDYEDYDPCESSEDITEKDLAVLLKEEAAKLKNEKTQKAESQNDKKPKPYRDADAKQKETWKGKQNDGDSDDEDESEPKKKPCKYIKNPFFTNRLKFSNSHLPLPPPGPPPQNFAPASEESITKVCPKKKKKCRKDDKKTIGTKEQGGTIEFEEVVEEREGRNLEEQTENKQTEPKEWKEKEEKEEKEGNEENEPNGVKDSGLKMKKKRCKKTTEKPTILCKKKESEVSITFQPRKIPMQQKDLPEILPYNTPEVERQILMARGKSEEEDCKKKCKKKDKVK